MPRSKKPFMPFYVGDYFGSSNVAQMSAEERALYDALLFRLWQQKRIQFDVQTVSRLTMISERIVKRCWPRIKHMFDVDSEGWFFQEKVETIRLRHDAWSKSGQQGMDKRYNKRANERANEIAYQGETPNNLITQIPNKTNSKTQAEGNRVRHQTAPLIAPRVCPPGMKHAWCDGRMHVPLSLHQEFQRLSPNGFDLMEWYAVTDEAWADKPIGDDAFTFWRSRWREKHGTTASKPSENSFDKSYEEHLEEIKQVARKMQMEEENQL